MHIYMYIYTVIYMYMYIACEIVRIRIKELAQVCETSSLLYAMCTATAW